jgi:signal transduction histidine kinase
LSPIVKALKREKEFVANVSHELRTPITAIQTASEVALRTTNRTLDEYRAILHQSLDESRRLRKMVDEMLLLSRSEAGVEKLNMVNVNLVQLISDVVRELTPMAVQKNVELVNESAIQTLEIKGDKNRLKQLFLILVDNAIKYSKSGGSVFLGVNSGLRPSVFIKDQGIGMSKEDQLHIFEKFYRADKTRGKVDGSGLGLSIAHWIVTQHHARINVESELGKGTTFTVTFDRSVF